MVNAEHNYKIYDKEMLAIICALEDWWHYLEGLPQPFNIISDHHNLQYWHTAQNLTHREAHWSLYLSQFDFSLTYKPGTTNTQADPLFHIPLPIISDIDNNHDQIILKPDHFLSVATLTMSNLNSLEDDIHAATNLDPQVCLTLQTLQDNAPHQLLGNLTNWEQCEGLVFFQGCVYVP
jgi:hypothetical protein